MDMESSCTKTKLLFESLAKEVLTAAFRENEFEKQGDSDE